MTVTRTATPDDAAQIAAVNVASWRAAYAGLMPDDFLASMSVEDKTSSWSRTLAAEHARTLVAIDAEGAVCGYATAGRDPDSGAGSLLMMYVHPDRWGTGDGRALITNARVALRDLGYPDAILWVLEANPRARRFYEADGWTHDGTTHDDDYGGATLRAVRYARAL